MATGEVDTLMVAFTDMQGRLMGKRVSAPAFLDGVIDHGAHVCTYLLGTDMEMNTPDGFALMNWETGYGDYVIAPVWDTPARAALAGPHGAGAGRRGGRGDRHARSRSRRAPSSSARSPRPPSWAWPSRPGSEFEYYLLTDSYEAAARKGFIDLERFGHYNEDYHLLQATKAEPVHGALRRLMTAARIPIEFSKGEAAAGQHEVNIRYDHVLESADRSVIFKHGAKEIAWRAGLRPDVHGQARPHLDRLVGHLHMSAWGIDDDRPLFFQDGCGALRHVRHDALVPGRHDGAVPGAGHLLRTQHQLLQAVRGRQLGARQRGLGSGQPHDRVPGRGAGARRCTSSAASRAAT